MPGVKERTINLNFSGGLNVQTPPTEISDNELTVCENYLVGDSGELLKRNGLFKWTTLSSVAAPYSFIGYNPGNGTLLIGAPGVANTTYAVGPANGSVNLFTGLPSNETPSWFLWINGTGYVGFVTTPGIKPLTGLNSVGATLANSPGGSQAVWHKGRIFSSVDSVRGRVAFSDPNAPATWQTTSTLDIGVDDNEPITALVTLGDLLLIFKQTSIWNLYVQGDTPANWVARKISGDVGAVQGVNGQKTAVVHDTNCYFISQPYGIYKTNGTTLQNISLNVWLYPQGVYGFGTGRFRLAFWRDFLIVVAKSNNTSLAPSKVMFFYNLTNKAWSTWTFLSDVLDDAFTAVGTTGTYVMGILGNILYGADSQSDAAYYDALIAGGFNSFADGFLYGSVGTGTAFTAQFTSKEFTTGVDEFSRIKWAGLEYLSRTPGPSFNMIHDGVSNTPVVPGFHATLRKGYKIPGAGRSRVFQLNCSHALTSPFEFYRASLHYTGKVPILSSGTP